MDNLNALQQVDAALDTTSKSLLARYGGCVSAGGTNCDAEFNAGLSNLDSSAAGRASDVKNAMQGANACVQAGNDPSTCFRQMASALSSKYITPASVPNAGSAGARMMGLDPVAAQPKFPMTALEAAGAGMVPHGDIDADQQMAAAKAQIDSTLGGFDPSQIYASVPSVNPLALIPNDNLIGRSRTDMSRDIFARDVRPPVFTKYEPWSMLINSRRMAEMETQQKRFAELKTGVGYSGAFYCS